MRAPYRLPGAAVDPAHFAMFEQILAALFVLALLVATLWLLRRKGIATMNLIPKRFGTAKRMQIVERVSLTAHHSLHLIRVQNRTILVGVSPSGCNRLASFRESSSTGDLERIDEIS